MEKKAVSAPERAAPGSSAHVREGRPKEVSSSLVTAERPGGDGGDVYVENTTFMINRLYEDTAPGQAIRELTVNGLQWLPPEGGRVIWTVHKQLFDSTGVSKLCCVDTGVGMTGPKLVEHVRGVYKSGRPQGLEHNFGVGGRISTAPANPEGVVYQSWVDGRGAMAILNYDRARDRYSLKPFEFPDGTFNFWAPVPDSEKPKFIDGHGTAVTLLGRSENEDTTAAPPSMPTRSRWLLRYLNGRFFRLPGNAEVEVHENWHLDDSRRNTLRGATGLEAWLNSGSIRQAFGRVRLTGAIAHWWIIREDADTNSGHYPTPGIVAALWQDELYDMYFSTTGNARLQSFGIIFGMRRVAIVVEPDVLAGSLTTNTARTTLQIDREPLPWELWMAEFRTSMPAELRALSEYSAPKPADGDHRRALQDRLKNVVDLFRFSRYRASPLGSSLADPSSRTKPGLMRSSSSTDTAPLPEEPGGSGSDVATAEEPHTHKRRPRKAVDYFTNLAAAGQPAVAAVEVSLPELPAIHWCSLADDSRERDEMDDAAARYLPETNTLKINADFRVIADLKLRWAKKYASVSGAAPVVERVVEEWVEMQLVEAIISAKALEGTSKRWTTSDVPGLWSETALTAVVLPRFHMDRIIARTLGDRITSLSKLSNTSAESELPAGEAEV